MLRALAQHDDDKVSGPALGSLLVSERLRGRRDAFTYLGAVTLANPTGTKRRTIYDAQKQPNLPGKLVRSENSPKNKKDRFVNEAYDYSGATYDFYEKVFGRKSIDGKGMRLDSTVHYRENATEAYDNAFWDGSQMIYGDGDAVIFDRFTKCLDVVGHELTHGVTQYEAGLAYHGQSGALNESFSNVFGSLVKQWKKGEKADKADWLIGAGLLTKKIKGVALRSMKAPGTAYDDPQLGGKDPQPGHMKDYVQLADTDAGDSGGVHLNSGIPNHAFYLAATAIGGFAWEKAGLIWYDALCNQMRSDSQFSDAATATITVAANRYGNGSKEHNAVKDAWKAVGVVK
jgi:Zn-dependent metalloprotease